MLEICNFLLDFILQNEWASKLLYVIFCIIAVGFVSLIKIIVSYCAKKNNKNFEKKNLEFIFSLLAFIFSFALIFSFMHIHKQNVLVNKITNSALGALASQGIYALFCQPIRKTLEKLKNFFIKIFNKAKKGAITTNDIDNALNELVKNENNTTAIEEFNKYIRNE